MTRPLVRNSKASRRWYGGGIPVAEEPHKFFPMNAAERSAAGFPALSLRCRTCEAQGLYGRDGKYRHMHVPQRRGARA
jgi:hypothetical protein